MAYKTPAWVKWQDEIIEDEVVARMLKKYHGSISDFYNTMVITTDVVAMDYDTIRDAVTFISARNCPEFEPEGRFNDSYEKFKVKYQFIQTTKANLNEWVDTHLSDSIRDLYNFYDTKYNREKYRGDRRFDLLNRTSNKGYSEMMCLKAAVRFQCLKDDDPTLVTSIETAKMLYRYIHDLPHWTFGCEYGCYEYDIDRSEEEFQKVNRMRIREIKKQDEFIHAVFVEKDIHKALAIMPQDDKIDL